MNHLFVRVYMAVSIGILTCIVAVLAYWTLQPYTLPTVEEPIRVLNLPRIAKDELPFMVDLDQETFPIIKIGEPFIMEIKVNKPEDISPTATRYFECISGNLVTLTPSTTDLPTGTYVVVTPTDFSDPQRVPIVTPNKFTENDICRFGFDLEYNVNPITKPKAKWFSEWGLVKE